MHGGEMQYWSTAVCCGDSSVLSRLLSLRLPGTGAPSPIPVAVTCLSCRSFPL